MEDAVTVAVLVIDTDALRDEVKSTLRVRVEYSLVDIDTDPTMEAERLTLGDAELDLLGVVDSVRVWVVVGDALTERVALPDVEAVGRGDCDSLPDVEAVAACVSLPDNVAEGET